MAETDVLDKANNIHNETTSTINLDSSVDSSSVEMSGEGICEEVSKSESFLEIVDSSNAESTDISNSNEQDEPGNNGSLSKIDDSEEMFVIDKVGCSDSNAGTEQETTIEKEKHGIYPENPFLKDDIIPLNTDVEKQPSGMKEPSAEKDIHGIFPANPFSKDIIATSNTGEAESRKDMSVEKEKRGIFPAIPSSDRNKSTSKLKELESKKDIFKGVSIDVEGDLGSNADEDKDTPHPYPVHEIPKYNASVAGVLSDIEYSMEDGKKIQDAKPKKSCFNCLGDHNVPECPEPPNYQRIAANRKKLMSSRVSSVRYHEDCDNKYGQYRAGKISEHLREALGLRYGELPIFIYRMRYLGYPPGWLKEAEVQQAEMKLYDGAGQSVIHPDAEEGEVDASQVKYNPDKLISYPGFNVDLPRGYRDEWRAMNFLPMQSSHRKSEFKRFMEMNKAGAYKKRKLKDEHLKSSDTPAVSGEMDIDESEVNTSAEIEFNPPLPDEPLPPLPPEESPASPDSPKVAEEGEITGDDSESSMGFLEAKRKTLLEQLGDSGNPSVESSQLSDLAEKETVISSDTENDTESVSQCNEDSENSRSSNSVNIHKKLKKHHRSHSKGFQLGAAIPPSITPFTCLPDAEKWTVDVTDHINFENLPDALGTWDKMKGLVKKVRRRMDIIHMDED